MIEFKSSSRQGRHLLLKLIVTNDAEVHELREFLKALQEHGGPDVTNFIAEAKWRIQAKVVKHIVKSNKDLPEIK